MGRDALNLRFQVLRVAFEIAVDSAEVAAPLRFLCQSAVQPEPPQAVVHYQVRSLTEGYEILREGVVVDHEFDPEFVREFLWAAVYWESMAAWSGEASLLRAATANHGGRRFIVVGEDLRDRARLALHLMVRFGADVEGDDIALLHDGKLTPYPRPLRVCGVDQTLPAGAPPRDQLPFSGNHPMTGSWVLDLASAGIDWRITSGPVDVIVLLETNYGGDTRVTDLRRPEASRALLSQCESRAGPVAALRATSELADRADCRKLRLGTLADLDDSLLQELLAAPIKQGS